MIAHHFLNTLYFLHVFVFASAKHNNLPNAVAYIFLGITAGLIFMKSIRCTVSCNKFLSLSSLFLYAWIMHLSSTSHIFAFKMVFALATILFGINMLRTIAIFTDPILRLIVFSDKYVGTHITFVPFMLIVTNACIFGALTNLHP